MYYESVSRVIGGEVISASYRIRTGKTKREREVKQKTSTPVENVKKTKK